jgi:hypothetical protein
MKLRILILSIFGTFIFNSCTSDSNSSENTNSNSILPKKIIITGADPGHFSCDFFYNQNKIDYIDVISLQQPTDFPQYKLMFTYTGDLISEIEKIDIQSGVMFEKINYTYQNNQLISKTNYQLSLINPGTYDEITRNYVYNLDGTVTSNLTPFDPSVPQNFIYYFTDGLIRNYINTEFGNPYNLFEYFTTDSPFKNIIGLEKILFCFNDADDEILTWVFNLPIKNIKSINSSYSGPNRKDFEYSYNENMFPIIIYEYWTFQNSIPTLHTTKNITYY